MHVVQVCSERRFHGGEHFVLQLSLRLQASCRVTIACAEDGELRARAEAAGLSVLPLPFHGNLHLRSMRLLADYCRREDVGLLNAHPGRDYAFSYGTCLLAPHLRFVITRHVIIPVKRTVFHRLIFRRVDRIICVSDAVRRTLLAHPAIDPAKLVTLYSGVETARFRAAAPGSIRDELGVGDLPLIGIVGAISDAKGQETLLRALPDVPDAHLLIVGAEDEPGMLAHLSALCAELGITQRVHILGPRSDVPELMRALTALVLASREETFGMVLPEAMAAGIPVIGTNAGGVPEIIDDGDTGLLVPPLNPAALAAAVTRLIADPALAARLAAAGQAKACAKFDVATMIADTLAVYREVL
jgi:glycosyltransferase involved in cell wall biosynthesis